MAETYELSPAAHERLVAEHAHLTTEWRIEIARRIEAARELGDLSENGDYHAAKEEQGKTEARIRHIEALLEGAEIVEGDDDVSEVSTGTIVSVRYAGDDDVERYLIGSIEERREDVEVMSPGSALGGALLGRSKGETVGYETPTGATLEVEIVDIER